MDSAPNKRILIVDDEPGWRGRVLGSLTEAGYDVLAAKDATEAMVRADQAHWGLIIVDDNLGGESGLVLARFLHRNNPGIPILLYTSREYDDMTMLDLMREGANQCLPKGNMEDLIATVGCYLS